MGHCPYSYLYITLLCCTVAGCSKSELLTSDIKAARPKPIRSEEIKRVMGRMDQTMQEIHRRLQGSISIALPAYKMSSLIKKLNTSDYPADFRRLTTMLSAQSLQLNKFSDQPIVFGAMLQTCITCHERYAPHQVAALNKYKQVIVAAVQTKVVRPTIVQQAPTAATPESDDVETDQQPSQQPGAIIEATRIQASRQRLHPQTGRPIRIVPQGEEDLYPNTDEEPEL